MGNHARTPRHRPGRPTYRARPTTPPPATRGEVTIALTSLGVLAVIIAVMLVANHSDSGEQVDTPNGRATAVAAVAAAPPGTEVRDGALGFVVTGVDTNVSSVGDGPRTARGTFVIVRIDVTNVSDQPRHYSGDNQKLVDTRGRAFATDTATEQVVDPTSHVEISPGNRISTTIIFDIPREAEPDRIEFHDAMLSDGAAAAVN